MKTKENCDFNFLKTVWKIALPVALQSMLQASFGIVDQIMIGRLGGISVAGVGLAGKFASLYSVVIAAVGTAAGIMIAQYIGQKNKEDVRRSFFANLFLAVGIALLFTLLCFSVPEEIMGLYTQETDLAMRNAAAEYLSVYAWSFILAAVMTLAATLLRCMEKATIPLYAGFTSALLNTFLNYVLIFGRFGFASMGAKGAAVASVIAQIAGLLIVLVLALKDIRELIIGQEEAVHRKILQEEMLQKEILQEEILEGNTQQEYAQQVCGPDYFIWWKRYAEILIPILICEFFWSLGENVYAGIYGHLGTDACAAMTLTGPIQSLVIGALCGLSQAAGIIVGKMLGNGEYEEAYTASKKLIIYGFAASILLSLLVFIVRSYYVLIYHVEDTVRGLTMQILTAYAVIAPLKVSNMILGGGIIRSGGKTGYVMGIDLIGTWIFGVPLGLFAAFILHLPIPYVYFILSLEEGVRLLISLIVFCKKRWMRSL